MNRRPVVLLTACLSLAAVTTLSASCSLNTQGLEPPSGASTSSSTASGTGGADPTTSSTTGTGGMGGTGGMMGTGGTGGTGGMMGPVCGNSVVEAGEQCDDGATAPGDGCSDTCQIEAGDNCPGTPVSLSPPGITLKGDLSVLGVDLGALCGVVGTKDGVYAVTPTVSGALKATLKSQGDKSLSVRSECPSTHDKNVVEFACARDAMNDVVEELWVHAGVTYYVIVDGDDSLYELDLRLAVCGDGVVTAPEQCDPPNGSTCIGCVGCNGPGEFWDSTTSHCYKFDTTPRTWRAARNECVKWGGDLVGINSASEQAFLVANQKPPLIGEIWASAYKDKPCSFVWANGEPWRSAWIDGEPNGSGECGRLLTTSGLRLADQSCGIVYASLCERVPGGSCGDGIVQPGESCDDMNTNPNDGCDACKRKPTCNGGGVFEDANTKHCYRVVKNSAKDWVAAKADCESWGGYLASIESQAENDLIKAQLSNATWIGAWEGGYNNATIFWEMPLSSCSFQAFAGGEPNGILDRCVDMGTSGAWGDSLCSQAEDYVCERAP